MSDFYPLVLRAGWSSAGIIDAVDRIATDFGFKQGETLRDVHEQDTADAIADIIRCNNISSPTALEGLQQQESQLTERYNRTQHRWSAAVGELILVICESNLIPFPDPDIEMTGEIWFACGWLDLAMSDASISSLGIEPRIQELPLLFGEN